MNEVPSARLGGLYALYFAIVALSIGWFGPFFKSLGLSSQEIGIAIGVLTGSKIIAPYFWGYLGDHLNNRLRVVQCGILGSTVSCALLLTDFDFLELCLVLMCFGLFWNAIIAQFDTITLEYLGDSHHKYSQIRVWGSVGFIVMMLGSGWLFSFRAFDWLPWIMIVGLVLSGFLSLSLPVKRFQARSSQTAPKILDQLNQPVVLLFFTIASLNQFTHGPLNVFFTLYLQDHGYSALIAGQLWSLGVFAEVILFFVLPRWIGRLDLRLLLSGSLMAASLRWFGTAYFVDSLWALALLQLTHALTFGAIHAVSIEFIRRWFPGQLSGRGMALYSGLVFGLGGSLGALSSGYLWDTIGGAASFSLMGVMTLIAAIVSVRYLHNARLDPEFRPTTVFG
ncbi:MFS transporter [Litorivicinus sp.]|nr:MFS transporter [Litorivicinus sp.]MDC1208815.1 MFS transporter [Litorivicinus sp.]MDC1240252.1 MFS transporter [Litorivicinus sp.]